MARGSPCTTCITPGPNQVLCSADSYPGLIYNPRLEGKVPGVFGQAGKQLKHFGWIHEIACPSESKLIVAELLNRRVRKLLPHP